MNEPTLEGFNRATEAVIKKHETQFRKLTAMDTDTGETNKKPNEVSYTVTKTVLEILKDLLMEKIGYLDSDLVSTLSPGINEVKKIKGLVMNYDGRDIVESSDYIQPIPIAVITDKDRKRVLMVKKSDKRVSAKSPEKNKSLLYIGGHVRKEDEKIKDVLNTIEKCLHREIQEEIGESISVTGMEPFLIFTPDTERSRKHLAVCYILELDLHDKMFRLTSNEFIQKTGTSKSGQILTVDEVVAGKYELEGWSINILEHIFGKIISQNLSLNFDEPH